MSERGNEDKHNNHVSLYLSGSLSVMRLYFFLCLFFVMMEMKSRVKGGTERSGEQRTEKKGEERKDEDGQRKADLGRNAPSSAADDHLPTPRRPHHLPHVPSLAREAEAVECYYGGGAACPENSVLFGVSDDTRSRSEQK